MSYEFDPHEFNYARVFVNRLITLSVANDKIPRMI